MNEIGRINTRLGTTEARMLNTIAAEIHRLNEKWWIDIEKKCIYCNGHGNVLMPTGNGANCYIQECSRCGGTGHPPKERNVGEMLMLIVSEVAEAMEGDRKNLMDDHLPHRRMFDVELADAVIRIFDLVSVKCPEFGEILVEKCEYNAVRADHKTENRLLENGKKY